MTKLEELRAAYEAATPGEWWEDDDACVAVGFGDDFETIIDANLEETLVCYNANFIALAHNMMPQLLEAVERLEAMQRVIGELASTNPFLVGEFEKNKAVLEKLK